MAIKVPRKLRDLRDIPAPVTGEALGWGPEGEVVNLPVAQPALAGIWVGNTPPPLAVTYETWLTNGNVGYWGWINPADTAAPVTIEVVGTTAELLVAGHQGTATIAIGATAVAGTVTVSASLASVEASLAVAIEVQALATQITMGGYPADVAAAVSASATSAAVSVTGYAGVCSIAAPFSSAVGGILLGTTPGATGATVGFAPKLVMTYAVNKITAYDADVSPAGGMSFGAYDGTNAVSINTGVVEASAQHSRLFSNGSLLRPNVANAVEYTLNPTSLTETGFTADLASAPPANRITNFAALGGSTLTNVKVGVSTGRTSTGNLVVTGLGFRPTALIVFTTMSSAAAGLRTAEANSFLFGAASAPGAQWAGRSELISRDAISGAILYSTSYSCTAALTSFDADGFTLNYSVAGGAVHDVGWIALRSANAKAGLTTIGTGVGTLDITGVGFRPAHLICATHGTIGAEVTASVFNIGMVDNTPIQRNAYTFNSGSSGDHSVMGSNLLFRDQGLALSMNLNSYLADGFRVNKNAAAIAYSLGYLALG